MPARHSSANGRERQATVEAAAPSRPEMGRV
jgi:hypothetical protein